MIWGVEVNEISVLTYGGSDANWWIRWRARFEQIGRITILGSTIPGDIVHVACESRKDAQELRDSWIANGWMHKSASKIRQLKQGEVSEDGWASVTACLERLRAWSEDAS